MRPGAAVVLDALLEGRRVSLEIETTDRLVEYDLAWQDDQLWIVGRHYAPGQYPDGEPQEVLLSTHGALSFESIVRAANRISPDRLAVIAADTALTRIHRERWDNR